MSSSPASNCSPASTVEGGSSYTRRQVVTLAVFSVAQFCNALLISLQAPFYPKEAESKGASPSQYGFVFGIYELTIFVVSPIYGRFLGRIGVCFVNNTGLLTVGYCCILFGLMGHIQGAHTFITFSLVVRVFEALGSAAFTTAAFSIIAREFPSKVGVAFSYMETFFGLGLIVGPTVGGALYSVGGFQLPFIVVGCAIILSGVAVAALLPHQEDQAVTSPPGLVRRAIGMPCILLGCVTVCCASFSIGFLQATLEAHLQPFSFGPLMLGVMFVLNGAAYAISAPVWGVTCDKWMRPRLVCLIGAVLVCVSFVLVGPAPFLRISLTKTLVTLALLVHGIGFGAQLVASFAGLHRDSLAQGLPDSIDTYGLVSGLWTSWFALGAFLGPSLGGILMDYVGFPWAAQSVVGVHTTLGSLTIGYLCWEGIRGEPTEDLREGVGQKEEARPLLRQS